MKPRFLFLAAGLLLAAFVSMPRFDHSMPQTESGCICAIRRPSASSVKTWRI